MSGDLFLSQTSMLTTWMLKSKVNGTCQALHRNDGMTDGQKLLESEEMECRGAGLAQTSLVPLAVVASMATMATMVPEAVAALLAPNEEKLMDSEVSDGWTKLVECELRVPAKLMENELMDCFR